MQDEAMQQCYQACKVIKTRLAPWSAMMMGPRSTTTTTTTVTSLAVIQQKLNNNDDVRQSCIESTVGSIKLSQMDPVESRIACMHQCKLKQECSANYVESCHRNRCLRGGTSRRERGRGAETNGQETQMIQATISRHQTKPPS
jgi:hypothetical protein